jgi:hypothetical protein
MDRIRRQSLGCRFHIGRNDGFDKNPAKEILKEIQDDSASFLY